MDSPTIGRIVRYVMDDGAERPAMIVHVASQVDDVFKCDLHVFTRGDRDNIAFGRFPTRGAGMALVPDVRMGDGPRTFHFPERRDGASIAASNSAGAVHMAESALERVVAIEDALAKTRDAFLRLEVMIAKLDDRLRQLEPPEGLNRAPIVPIPPPSEPYPTSSESEAMTREYVDGIVGDPEATPRPPELTERRVVPDDLVEKPWPNPADPSEDLNDPNLMGSNADP